jgi:hypothetical protein
MGHMIHPRIPLLHRPVGRWQYGSAMMNAVEMTAGMHAALDDRAEAWRFLTRFAAEWRAPLGAGDGYESEVLDEAEERLGVRLPAALREVYELLGRRDDLLRNQNRLLRPEQLYLSEGALVYQTENQGAAEWGIHLEEVEAEDPPTAIRSSLMDASAERWEPWTKRLSAAVTDLVMSETVLCERDGLMDATDLIDEQGLSEFEPLPTLLPEHHGSAWYLGQGVILHVLDEAWLTARGQNPEALDSVRVVMAGNWING